MLGARSVAVVGASARPDSFGERMVIEALRGSARVHLVNPRYDRIGELACVPSLADLDEPVDLVLLGVPDVRVDRPAPAAAGGRRPLGGAVRLGARTARRGRRGGAGRGHGAVRGGLHGLRQQRARRAGAGLPRAGSVARAAAISLVTHSGSAFSTLLRARRGFGFRLAVSSGQELVTDTADYVEYALDDPETADHRAADGDPARRCRGCGGSLLRAAEPGRAGGHPDRRRIADRAGRWWRRTPGRSPVRDAAWQAFCASVGAVRVRDLAELTDTLELFAAGRRAASGANGSPRCTIPVPSGH